jgi:organic radical activating enzyme
MTNIFKRFLQKDVEKIETGLYHYIAPPDDPRNYRLHLRVEEDGSGILIINAATILHLNQTATDYAFYMLQNIPADIVAKNINAKYQVDVETAHNDYTQFTSNIQTLINTPDLDPETFLGIDRQEPFTGSISAPYRLDCAITYKLPDVSNPQFAPTKNVDRELTTQEWETILDKAHQVGIPHIIFTGGEPTIRQDLPELVKHAEKNDQITGLLTNGLKFVDNSYLTELLQNGLDHVLLLLNPDNQQAWIALENCSKEDLFVAIHLTITEENQNHVLDYIHRIAQTDVKAISLSIQSESLKPVLEQSRNVAADLGLDLVWNLPVPYSSYNPVGLETNILSTAKGAGRAWLYVEPDGDILPTQGADLILGNLLTDAWENIWKRK